MADELDLSGSNVSFGDGDLGGPEPNWPCSGGPVSIGCIAMFCGTGWCYSGCTETPF